MTTTNALAVNELFETFQGEAYYTGTPAVFIRLQGCDVGCPWCDTKHTWLLRAQDERPIADIMAKTEDAQTYAVLDGAELAALVARTYQSRHVVITGGEPCRFDLTELTKALSARCRVQIETSGTEEIRVSNGTWVTVSPKIDMPSGFRVRLDALTRADELKMPVGKMADIEKLDALLATLAAPPPLVWLQPLSQSAKATELCLMVARQRHWRLSLQTHKFAGVR